MTSLGGKNAHRERMRVRKKAHEDVLRENNISPYPHLARSRKTKAFRELTGYHVAVCMVCKHCRCTCDDRDAWLKTRMGEKV